MVKDCEAFDGCLTGKRVLITGATGSLGSALTRRLSSGRHGRPAELILFSRDEYKQFHFRAAFGPERSTAGPKLTFQIGDIRDPYAVQQAVRRADVVFHTAALKQVPQCEYNPLEAVQTNIMGLANLVRAVSAGGGAVEAVVAASTDKACYPVNVMGMTKALQERVLIAANLHGTDTRFMCARYGNVMGSRGSMIEIFESQIRAGGPVTLTDRRMTRFVVTLDDAVDALVATYRFGRAGEIFVPRAPGVLVAELAEELIGDRDIALIETGIRPGEKINEILVTEEEIGRVAGRQGYLAIGPMLEELSAAAKPATVMNQPFRSDHRLLDRAEILDLLDRNDLLGRGAPARSRRGQALRRLNAFSLPSA